MQTSRKKKAASEGMKLVHASGERFLSWINNLSIQPAIKDFKSYLDELMDKELTKDHLQSHKARFHLKTKKTLEVNASVLFLKKYLETLEET